MLFRDYESYESLISCQLTIEPIRKVSHKYTNEWCQCLCSMSMVSSVTGYFRRFYDRDVIFATIVLVTVTSLFVWFQSNQY